MSLCRSLSNHSFNSKIIMTDAKKMSANVSVALASCGDCAIAIYGDLDAIAKTPCSLSKAASDALLFNNSANADLTPAIEAIKTGIIIARGPLAPLPDLPKGLAIIETVNARLGFARCVRDHFAQNEGQGHIHPTAVIEADVHINPTASIGAHCYIGAGCSIGAGTRIAPNVTIYNGCAIGANVTINAGTVIGADGFGYEQNSQGGYEKFPHMGGVIIEDGVDIGANTCVDRGVLDNTIIKKRARIDNLVHVAHNVVIGEDAIVIALTMLGGSVTIGDRAWIAPAATIINQKNIGADAVVGLAAVVTKDVQEGQTVMGAPAVDQAQFKAQNLAMKALLK
jgi:UDP-3-O-[3-hydroxymyristoyl] glucosamine N-acyltransferase